MSPSEKARIDSIRNLGSILAAVRPFQLPFYSFASHNVSWTPEKVIGLIVNLIDSNKYFIQFFMGFILRIYLISVSLIFFSSSSLNLVRSTTNSICLYFTWRTWGYWQISSILMVFTSPSLRPGSFIKKRKFTQSSIRCRLPSGKVLFCFIFCIKIYSAKLPRTLWTDRIETFQQYPSCKITSSLAGSSLQRGGVIAGETTRPR